MSEVEVLLAEGLRLSQWINLASATLLLYDHAINLDDEVKHFWSGPWTFSRGMYFSIRYLGFIYVMILIAIVPILYPVLSAFLIYGVEVVVMTLCQAAITTRVWYMFVNRPVIRTIAVQAFVATTVANALLAGFLWSFVRAGVPQLGRDTPRNPLIALLYVPSLFLHSLLFALKLYRFITSPKYLQRDTFLWRFMKEGMIMYACALGSLLFLVIGLTRTDFSQIPVYEVAFTGGITFMALTIVSVCRGMLSIKSLAATVHVDPGWLLNHAELSRVHWRQGATDGEIVVESFDLPMVSPLLQGDQPADTKGTSSPSGLPC